MKKKFTFLIMALFALIASPGRAEVVSGTTYETKSTSSLPNGWTGNGEGTSYIQLTSSSNHITTDNFIQNGFTSIVLKARKYGGPSNAQALITVSWYDAATSNETVLGTIAPTNTTLTNYTISSPTNPTGNTSGYIKIQCKGASSGKGSGVSEVTISYTAGSSTDPSITVNPSTITWDNSPINVQLSETISVSQANLTNNITIASTIGNVSSSTIAAGEDATDVILTYTPPTTGDFEGTITFTSGEAIATVSVTGSAYDPSQVVTYEKVTSVNDLVAGASYILVCPTKNKAAGAMGSNAYFSSKDATLTDNTVTSDDAIELVLGGTTGAWTFTTSEGLIGTTEAKKLNHAGNGTTTWTIDITSGEATITSTATGYGSIKYNASSPRFLNYASGQTAVALYKKAENKAATPTLTESQIFTAKPFEVTITNNEAGATVYYTTNGDNPTTETTTNFTGASTTININATTTVKAMAVVEGKANSEIASATYTEQKTDPENQWSAETYTATIGGENTFPEFYTQSDGAVTYTSSNTNAATIDATGTITLVAAGTTTITASTAETTTYMAGNASYTLTVKDAPLSTMDAIFEKATAVGTTATNVEVTFNNWVISGVKGSNAYLTDNAGKGLIIYTSNHGFAVGDVLNGTIACQIKLYSGASELMGVTSETSGLTVTKNGEITIHEVSIADLSGVNTGAVIIASNVIYTGSDNVFSDGENTIKAYYTFMTLPSFTNGDRYNLTGVYIQYNNTKEIAPRSGDDIVLIVAAPTFTPEGGNYNAAQTVTITSATTGATIYYTLDNSNPTTGSTPYTDPIEISENTTIKAIAVKNGVSSEIATAVYTITITTVATPTFDPEGGSYFNESLEVSLDCATNGATIVYTTDNWSTQTPYSDPFTITETTTVKAKATKTDMDDSEIAEATFTKRYKVNYVVNGNGSLFEPTYVTPSSAIGTLPTPDAEYIPTGFDFAGWTLDENEIDFLTAPIQVNNDMILYAVFSRIEGGSGETTWNLVTNSSEIVAGKVIKIAATVSGSSTTANNGTFAANGTISSSIMGKVSATISDNKLTNDEGAAEFTIGGTSGNWTLAYDGKLLGATAAKKLAYDDGTTTWGISIDGNAKASIANGTTSYGTILYNRDSPRFTTYTSTPSATMVLPQIFVKTVSGTTHYYTRVYDANTKLAKLTVNGPSIIMNGYTLTVTGSMSNTDPENLIIEDGAQLIVNNADVQATVKKNIAEANTRDSKWSDWYTISSPLADDVEFTEVENLIPGNDVTNTSYDLYRLNEAAGMWENSRIEDQSQNEFTTIDKGRGYLYARKDKAQLEFKGVINVADVENVNLTMTADKGKGFNLIGNPFTQNIKLTDVKSDGTAVLAGGFYVLNNDNTWATEPITTGTIAPLQGFLVQATTAGTATISKPTTAPSKGERSEQNTNIEMIVSNSTYRDNAFAMFGEGIGLNKVNHRNAQAPMLYVPQDGEKFAIAFMDENTTVFPLNFKAMTTGKYSISLKATDDINTLVLVDNMTGVETNMLLENSYSFNGSPADSEGRFTVKLSISHSNGQSDNEHFVYQNGSELVVNGEGTLQIFDVLGRVVISEEVHGQTVNVGGLSEGAYIVRMTGNEIKTQKIIIR